MRPFLKNTLGATAIEYAVIIAVVVLIMLGGLVLLGNKTSESFQNLADTAEDNM